MKIANSTEFSEALDFYCSEKFDGLEENEKRYFKNVLTTSIDKIEDARSRIIHSIKDELEIDGHRSPNIFDGANLKKISFIQFLSAEDQEIILEKYFKELYSPERKLSIILVLLDCISDKSKIKVIYKSDHAKMFKIMGAINQKKRECKRKDKKYYENHYNVFKQALVTN